MWLRKNARVVIHFLHVFLLGYNVVCESLWYTLENGHYIQTSESVIVIAKSVSNCAVLCMEYTRCSTFNYRNKNKTCELLTLLDNSSITLSEEWTTGYLFPKCQQGLADRGYNIHLVNFGVEINLRVIEPFIAECRTDVSSGKILTVIHHDQEEQTTLRNGCQNPLCFTADLTYTVSLQQAIGLVEASSHCYQTFRYDCIGSVLRHGSNSFAGWYGRDGSLYNYWSGHGSILYACDCGLLNNCDNGNSCNCNINDNTWRYDTGTLTDKDALPITRVGFGDHDGPSEQAYFQIGPLVCYD